MLGILRRYIVREIATALLAVLTVLVLIYISNRFIRLFAEVTSGGMSGDIVFKLLALKMLTSVSILLPLALFLAVLLAFGRLYKDNEMAALAACGVSLRTGFRAVLAFALLVASVVALVSLYLAPWAEEQAYRIQDLERSISDLAGLPEGRFVEPEGINGVIYAETVSAETQHMEQVFMQGQRQNRRQVILSAQQAEHQFDPKNGSRYLILHDGYRYEGIPGESDFRIIHYREHAIRISDKPVVASYRKQRARETWHLIGSERVADQAELQWRLSMPLSAVLLALLAVPLSRTDPRQGRYAKLFVAILAYVVYSNVLGVSQTWIERGLVPVWLGMWWVHLLMLLLVWGLLARHYGAAWLFRAMFRRARV